MDVSALAGMVLPYLTALVNAYGVHVLVRARDATVEAAADGTVGLGGKLLRRILGREESRGAVEAAVTDVAANPEDEDFQVALRAQIKKALAGDEDLAEDVAAMLNEAGVSITASGERSIAAHTISGIASTGDNTTIQR